MSVLKIFRILSNSNNINSTRFKFGPKATKLTKSLASSPFTHILSAIYYIMIHCFPQNLVRLWGLNIFSSSGGMPSIKK